MSRKRSSEQTADEKRAREIRQGLLIVHAILSALLVLGTRLEWWSVHVRGTLVESVFGSAHDGLPGKVTAVYMAASAVIAFFFTTYDLVADADFQWAPLLASAFAVGCCGQQTWQTFVKDFDRIAEGAIESVKLDDYVKKEVAEAAAHGASPAGGTAAVGSATTVGDEGYPFRIRLGVGLGMACAASAGMLLLSIYLTFFARRKTE